MKVSETRKRSLVKAFTWRIFAILITVAVLQGFTSDLFFSLTTGVVINVVKIICYYIHERIWSKVKWGYIVEEDKN